MVANIINWNNSTKKEIETQFSLESKKELEYSTLKTPKNKIKF